MSVVIAITACIAQSRLATSFGFAASLSSEIAIIAAPLNYDRETVVPFERREAGYYARNYFPVSFYFDQCSSLHVDPLEVPNVGDRMRAAS